MHMKILTGGSGPSFAGWKYWPTWTRMMPLYFHCGHKDVSGPAAGNLYISRSLIYHLQQMQPDIVIAQWNWDRFDVYVGQAPFAQTVSHSSSNRNFILDLPSSSVTADTGYWCSSKDNVIPWKKFYSEQIQSQKGTDMDDLQHMITLQEVCRRRGIQYRFLMHSPVPHARLTADSETHSLYREIDWQNCILPSLSEIRKNHATSHQQFDRIEEAGRITNVLNPMTQYSVLSDLLHPHLVSMGVTVRPNADRLAQYCRTKQDSLWADYVQRHA